MSGPRRKTDEVGAAGATHTFPLSDARFDQLLADFRVLEQPDPVCGASARIEGGHATLAELAGRLARACTRLPALAGDEAVARPRLVELVGELEPLAARVQLKLHRAEPGAFLFGAAGGQTVALPAAEVVDVLAGDEAQAGEARGVPRYSSASWWQGAAGTANDRLWALVEPNGDRALIGLEAYRGIHGADVRPAGGVWRGARGLRAIVVHPDLGAGFVPDLGVILDHLRRGAWTS